MASQVGFGVPKHAQLHILIALFFCASVCLSRSRFWVSGSRTDDSDSRFKNLDGQTDKTSLYILNGAAQG
jgi:hypothetical protein